MPEQLTLFDMSQFRDKWVPMFEPDAMDKLAGIGAMTWRSQLEKLNKDSEATLEIR